MTTPRLNRHSRIHHELFDEDTNQIGSLGEVVDKHAGDALFLGPDERSPGGADGGETDFEVEMNETDPAADEEMDPDDVLDESVDFTMATDQTGTVAGIARGFGTHIAQDLGREGFQIEEMPNAALLPSRQPAPGEELDDYDDAGDGQYEQSPELARASEPGKNPAARAVSEPMPHRYVTHEDRPHTQDDELDATKRLK